MLIFHIDCNFARYRTDYLRRWLHRLAALGYDAVLWELEDKVQWDTCPECVWPEAMSKAEFRSLLAEARGLGMTNIPLLQTIGHGEYVLKHEPYVAWRENPERHDCYCTSRPEVRTFLKQWIEEYIDLFGELSYFHLGGDEAYEFGTCPVCKPRAEQLGHNALYTEHMLDIAEPLLSRGIRPGIWCDMVLRHPDQMDSVPNEFVIWDWNYSGTDEPAARALVWGQGWVNREDVTDALLAQFPEMLTQDGALSPFYTVDLLQRLGRDVILCSAARKGGDGVFCGRYDAATANVVAVARKARTAGLLGSCVTSWAIRIHNYETQWPWLAMAARAHQHPEQPYDQIAHDTCRALTGLDGEPLGHAMQQIGTPLPFASGQDTGIQWNNLKDIEPAPADWIASRLDEWRRDDGEAFRKRQQETTQGLAAVLEGAAALNRLIPETTGGLELLEAWSRAAHHQLWAGRIAQAVLDKADGAPVDAADMTAVHESLKQDFAAWASEWLTPQCAEHAAGLVFDAVGRYLREGLGP